MLRILKKALIIENDKLISAFLMILLTKWNGKLRLEEVFVGYLSDKDIAVTIYIVKTSTSQCVKMDKYLTDVSQEKNT